MRGGTGGVALEAEALGVDSFIWDDKAKKASMCKLRLGDVVKRWDENRHACGACKVDNIRDMREHILLTCDALVAHRTEGIYARVLEGCKSLGASATETVCELLACVSKEGVRDLHYTYREWLRLSDAARASS